MDHSMEKNMEVEATSSCYLGFSESRISFTVQVRGGYRASIGKKHQEHAMQTWGLGLACAVCKQ